MQRPKDVRFLKVKKVIKFPTNLTYLGYVATLNNNIQLFAFVIRVKNYQIKIKMVDILKFSKFVNESRAESLID